MFNFVFLPLKHMTEYLGNDCRNRKLQFQITFSLSWMSCLLKLPNDMEWDDDARYDVPNGVLLQRSSIRVHYQQRYTDLTRSLEAYFFFIAIMLIHDSYVANGAKLEMVHTLLTMTLKNLAKYCRSRLSGPIFPF